ncbi:MAG: PEP-CTERM sorting domain-containing protein [Deltaproteobacteria bacterium]|nr:PEP-CTERM sorting domain-containing protein [Deltaproteobacteria bacterium]MBW2576652.1 PEP-CTERM sorting domain-containing protein [Deltaproteobacteria bacterium]
MAHPSATIDLIWDGRGTNHIVGLALEEIQLNVILTAGPAGSEGASISVDFSLIEDIALVVQLLGLDSDTPKNTPTRGADTVLPIEIEFPQIRESRVELINSVCFCDLGIGTGLEAGQSHQLGYVTFNVALLELDTYEITSDVDPTGGVLDGDGNEILPTTDITFNSAFLTVGANRNPRSKLSSPIPAPEPSALPVLGSGIAALALLYRRRRDSVEP